MAENYIKIKKIPLKKIYSEVLTYIMRKPDELAVFSIINFAFLDGFSIFVIDASSYLFLPWICAYYAFWFAFFRFYYNKRPLVFTKKILGTLGPSTKILFLIFFLSMLIVFAPFLPLLMGYNDEYAIFIDKYMSSIQTLSTSAETDNTSITSALTVYLIMLFLFPLIFIRPMFAWISALIGRSGSIRNAFANSKGNYWRFLILAVVFELPLSVIELLFTKQNWDESIMWLFLSPLIVLGNYAIAKVYDFLFLNPDNV